MRCGDLERYLEAFLDGRLGRSRTAILRRHLALCGACQGRVERLRQFEKDTRRRFRLTEQADSLWEGLELDLVGSSGAVGGGHLLAAPRPLGPLPGGEVGRSPATGGRAPRHPLVANRTRGRGAASKLAGAFLVAMALGAGYELLRGGSDGHPAGSAERAYLDFRQGRAVPDLSSGEVGEVAAWLTTELGRPVALPPVPEGYRLVGAGRTDLAAGASGALIYSDVADPEAAPVMLFVSPGPSGPADPVELPSASDADGLRQVRWGADRLSYTAVGSVPAERLLQFHH
jgi:anti-sigma factor RsiW